MINIVRFIYLLFSDVKVKVNLSLYVVKHRGMKAYSGTGDIALLIIYLGTRRKWLVSFKPRPPYSPLLWTDNTFIDCVEG